jgi:Holliday junction resolvase
MTNARKALGKSLEVKVAEKAVEAGFEAQVQPLSGILNDYPNDVLLTTPVLVVSFEAKVRQAEISGGEKYITINLDWLKKCITNLARLSTHLPKIGVVAFRAKRSQDLYVLMRYEDFLRILEKEKS